MSATRLVFTSCGLYGAAGVGLLAAGAHAGGPNATSAGLMLLLHALGGMAGTLARKAGFLHATGGRLAVAAMLLGAGLFAVAVGSPALAEMRPLPMAAPIGGSICILGWLTLAGAALIGPRV
jgi:uncharacterized membrane protein YgdD (TMEM256/DUF423 family)